MKAISNYVAAIITVSMIFTSIAFLISILLRQAEVGTEALNTMVEVSERACEKISISYHIKSNDTIEFIITNLGDIDVILTYAVITYKDAKTDVVDLGSLIVPIGKSIRYTLTLNRSVYDVMSIKILTYRGNSFDVYTHVVKPVSITILSNTTMLYPGEAVEIKIVVKNKFSKTILFSVDKINLTFTTYPGETNVTEYFTLLYRYPDEIYLKPGEETSFTLIYRYNGGLGEETINAIVSIGYTVVGTGDYIEDTFRHKALFNTLIR